MARVIKFIRLTKIGSTRSRSLSDFCPVWAPVLPPGLSMTQGRQLSEFDVRFGEQYFFYKATKEVQKFNSDKDYKPISVEKNGVLHHVGRILDGHQIECPVDSFLDLDPLCFVRPLVDRYSPVAYAIMMHAHCSTSNHRPVPPTLTESRSVAYILHGRQLAKEIYSACNYCKRHLAKTVEVEMGKLHDTRLYVAPPFFVVQCDMMGPFLAYCAHNHRSTLKIWGIVFKCVTTQAVSCHVVQDYSAVSVVQAFTRFGTSSGFPSLVIIDQGTQLVSAYEKMSINMLDLEDQLESQYNTKLHYQTGPARAHNYQGMVERSIKELKRLFNKVFDGLKMDSIAWETNLAWTANELNNFPVCLMSRTDDLGLLDILTPARILLGKNNRRAMSGYPQLEKPSKILDAMDKVYEVWWKIWKNERIIDFVPQPRKWTRNNQLLQIGDIVVFVKELPEDHFGKPLWKIARITDLEHSSDGLIRTCTVEYKNASQPKVRHTTRLSVRHVAKLHSEDDLDLYQELDEAAKTANDLLTLHHIDLRDELK